MSASDRQTFNPAGSHGWIQWKGTDVCMSIDCKCGFHGHLDAEFAYHVRCPICNTVYMCNGNIELVELTPEEAKEKHIIIIDIPE